MEPELQLEPTGPRSITARLALVAFVAVVALAIGVAAMANRSPTASVASTSTVPTSTSPAAITTAPTGLAHFDGDGLAFDYPATWTVVHSGYVGHYNSVLDYLGTSSDLHAIESMPTCSPDLDFGGEHRTLRCGDDLRVDAGQVLVTLTDSQGPPRNEPIDPQSVIPFDPSPAYLSVGGLPATVTRVPRSQLTYEWALSVLGQIIRRTFIDATFGGSDTAAMKAQVDAMIASIRYEPPPKTLDPGGGPRVAATTVASLQAQNGAEFGCFPSVPGTTNNVTLRTLVGHEGLSQPLPVTCSTAIEAEPIGLWRLTLTQTWTASTDRSAGALIMHVWTDGAGQVAPGQSGGSTVPYWSNP